jgi:signal transduction histidine kinase
VEDLGSRNGILVNGARVQWAVVNPGDEITLGETVFRVRQVGASTFHHAVIPAEEADSLHRAILEESAGARLLILYKAAQLLGTVFDIDELLNQILGLIFEALPVRRGFVLLNAADPGDPEIHATCFRDDEEHDAPLSRTLIRHVLDSQEAVLTLNAMEDSRFDASDSICGHGIQAAMCVPLCGRKALVGAIYVDAGASSTTFSAADLGLLTAIGRVVGVAVENARLYHENVQRERMAALGSATAGLGHCIKNILTGIRGGTEFITLALEQHDFKPLELGWPILSRAMERIDMLVMNMLLFSRDQKLERGPVDLNALVREVVEVVQERANRARIVFVLEAADYARAYIDGRQMYRVMLNLLVNAIEACESAGGAITVSVSASPKGFGVRVADTGPGIAPDVLPHLFEAFFSTKASSGTGLGLACSQKIVQQHGGAIEVQSAPGKGAIFTVTLPRVEPNAPNTEHAS